MTCYRVLSRIEVRVEGLARGGGGQARRNRQPALGIDATNLVRDDKNGASDVFLHDLHTSRTSLVSRSASGGTANGASTRPAISADGRFVAFESDASNLVSDSFLFDRMRDTMVRVSTAAESGWIEPSRSPAIAAHAPMVAFSSRRPMNDRDRGDDFDLFVRAGCLPGRGP